MQNLSLVHLRESRHNKSAIYDITGIIFDIMSVDRKRYSDMQNSIVGGGKNNKEKLKKMELAPFFKEVDSYDWLDLHTKTTNIIAKNSGFVTKSLYLEVQDLLPDDEKLYVNLYEHIVTFGLCKAIDPKWTKKLDKMIQFV